jgi:uncharacterized protein YhdP
MDLEQLLSKVLENDQVHARFLNTLSLQENIGARKISANERPETATYMVLKHAAEEHRHAFYLKKQIGKLNEVNCPTYEPDYLLAPISSKHYLHQLDMQTSRYLQQEMNLSKLLQQTRSKVSVRSIIIEEQGHLEEMTAQLKNFDANWEEHARKIIAIEDKLYHNWIEDLSKAI